MDSGISTSLNDIGGVSDRGFAVGDRGVILGWDGSEWRRLESGTTHDLRCVRGLPDGTFFAVGDASTVLLYDGQSWSPMPFPYLVDLKGVWAAAPDDVFAVGGRMNYHGNVFHWDGSQWSMMEHGSDYEFYDVFGFSSDDVWAAGALDDVWHYDGEQWSVYENAVTMSISRIYGPAADEVYFMNTSGGYVYKFDGSSWEGQTLYTDIGFADMDYDAANRRLIVVGDYGSILTTAYPVAPTPSPSASPSPTPATPSPPPCSATPSPEPSPSSTATPSPTLTATPTPGACQRTGVALSMPARTFRPGDPCFCIAEVCNSTGEPISGYPLFVILDVYGVLLFAPGFTEDLDSYLSEYPSFQPGETLVTVVQPFIWPEGAGAATGILWYGALTNPSVTEIVGDWSSWSFSWEM